MLHFSRRFAVVSLLLAVALSAPSFAQGDTCATATAVSGASNLTFNTTTFTTSGFAGGGACGGGSTSIFKDGFYQWTATVAGDYLFDTIGSDFDTMLSVHTGVGCAATCVGFNDDAQGLQSIVSVSGINAGDTFLVQVGGWGASSGNVNLNIGSFVDPCSGAVDDPFEENDFCNEAALVIDGTYSNLFVSKLDTDNYAACVESGGTLSVDLSSLVQSADLDLYLWSATSSSCGAGGVGQNPLTLSVGSGSNESIVWTNTTGLPAEVVIQVAVYVNASDSCAAYDLTIAGVGACGGPYVLATFCDPMVANSTGLPTVIGGTLNPGVASGVHLEATQGPPGQYGHFLVGTGANDPGIVSGQGRMCLAFTGGNAIAQYRWLGSTLNSIGRFDSNGTLQNLVGTSAVGTGFDVPIDLPNPVGGTIQSGQTLHFQLWHREAGGSSNFSNGLTVQF